MRPWFVLALTACNGHPPTEVPTSTNSASQESVKPSPDASSAHSVKITRADRTLHLQVKATERGLVGSYGPMTTFLITSEVARLLRTDGKCIYFFVSSSPSLSVMCPKSNDRPSSALTGSYRSG